jgi:thiol-disulfide isomerase/thioredoxin
MKQLLNALCIALCALCTSSCGARPASGDTSDVDTLGVHQSFELPEVPAMLTSPEDRLHFVVMHYWDRFDFRDTALIHLPDLTEQALVNYLDLLTRVDEAQADSSFARTFTAAGEETVMYHYFAENVRRYLYNPNSPLRNEDLYASAARYLAAHPEQDIAAQSRAVHDLKLIAMNRPGQPATDFPYVLRGGRKGTLRTLRTTVPVLVVFYNPDCESCVETLGQMRASQVLTQAVQSGRLTVLAVYTEGDADIWRQHAGELPDGWLDAQDPARVILEKELYDLSGMPSLYLLDKDKRVMLKDPTWPQVEAALQGAE